MTISRPWAVPMLVVAGLLLPLAGQAQDEEPPAPEGKGVLLVYKYKPGQVQKFRADVKADYTITPNGGAEGEGGGPGAVPLSSKMSFIYSEKVTGVGSGTGTLALANDSLTLTTSFAGNTVVVKGRGGKATTTINGQVTNPNHPGLNAAGISRITSTRAVTVRRSPQGIVTLVGGVPTTAAMMGGNPSLTLAQLSKKPVKVGDSWETTQRIRPVAPGGNTGGRRMPLMEIRFTHSLKSLAVRNGRQQALIESSGEATPVGGEATEVQSVTQSMRGVTRFDVARGAVVSGSYTVDMTMDIALPAGAGPTSVNLGGTTTLTFFEANAPAAKPARRR